MAYNMESNETIAVNATTKIPNTEELAQYYLKKHKITELLDNITAALVYERPDNPKAFIIEYIGKLKASRMAGVDYPCLFDESNIRSLFGIMDPANREYINHSQYKAGMGNLGVSTFERNPPGSDTDQIALDTFVSEAKDGLVIASTTIAT